MIYLASLSIPCLYSFNFIDNVFVYDCKILINCCFRISYITFKLQNVVNFQNYIYICCFVEYCDWKLKPIKIPKNEINLVRKHELLLENMNQISTKRITKHKTFLVVMNILRYSQK